MAKKIHVAFHFNTTHYMDVRVPEEMTPKELEDKFGHMLDCTDFDDMEDGWSWSTKHENEVHTLVFEGNAAEPVQTALRHFTVWED